MSKLKEVKLKTNLSLKPYTRLHIAYRTYMPKFISNKTRNIKVKYKLPLNLKFKIEVKLFCFKLNFISKSYRV
jgi:hypothetical protein